jgi:hypothetical protein
VTWPQQSGSATLSVLGWDYPSSVRAMVLAVAWDIPAHTDAVTKLFAAVAVAVAVPFLGAAPTAHADAYCELGNLLIPQEVHHVGTYRDATCAMVADIVTTSDASDCVGAVTDYVLSRGYDPYVGKDIALHNC